jgi:hypothetical protein
VTGNERSDPVQTEPDAIADYTQFPALHNRTGLRRWRVHQQGFAPWLYASGPGGRFNLDHPYGTLYVASRAEVALREAAGAVLVGAAIVDSDWADQRVVSVLIVEGRRLADFCSEQAPGFGIVPGEITGPFPGYRIPRAWARTLHGSGFDGIRYASRFSPARAGFCEAYFGPAGQSAGQHQSLTIRSLISDMPGYRIAERPSSMDITITSPD